MQAPTIEYTRRVILPERDYLFEAAEHRVRAQRILELTGASTVDPFMRLADIARLAKQIIELRREVET